jgi:hypothetical protein
VEVGVHELHGHRALADGGGLTDLLRTSPAANTPGDPATTKFSFERG